MAQSRYSGGCACGRVRFTATGAPLRVGLCHCTDCRKHHGTPFAAAAIYREADVELSGSVQEYNTRAFCPHCGSSVFSRSPGEIELHLGAFDRPNLFTPGYELWVSRREDWLPALPELEQFAQNRPLLSGFETERLRVAHWHAALHGAERQALIEALGPLLTPPVLRHLPPSLQLNPGRDALEAWIAARDAESCVLTVSDLNSGLIGLLILVEFPSETGRDIHLGYLLGEAAWGRGYASELIAGLVRALSADARPVTLIGGVMRENPASTRVLEKAGFIRATGSPEADVLQYHLTLPSVSP